MNPLHLSLYLTSNLIIKMVVFNKNYKYLRLRLSPQDIKSLCRVGFKDDKAILEIKDFRNILEERPKMREIWEKKLFQRILEAIKAKGLEVEKVFTLIDVDNNSVRTPNYFNPPLSSSIVSTADGLSTRIEERSRVVEDSRQLKRFQQPIFDI